MGIVTLRITGEHVGSPLRWCALGSRADTWVCPYNGVCFGNTGGDYKTWCIVGAELCLRPPLGGEPNTTRKPKLLNLSNG